MSLLLAFLGRLLATALLVVAISRVAEKLGPFLASVLITLPIFAGPSFFFLMYEQPPQFIAAGALYAFAGAGPVMAYTAGYIQGVRRFGLVGSLLCGSAAWALLTVPMRFLPIGIAGAFAWYAGGILIAWLFRRPFDLHARPTAPAAKWLHLSLRAGVAGFAVAVVTSLARFLGPETTGLVVAFPLTMSASMWLLHRQYGGEFAAATLSATQRTLVSYASFCLALHLLIGPLPVELAFWSAIAVSVASAMALAVIGRQRKPRAP